VSHAWLSIYIPDVGWVGLDPTNNIIPIDQHLILAWGRDYSDAIPALISLETTLDKG
jgi:transglutaminase-like putative cysteine protease